MMMMMVVMMRTTIYDDHVTQMSLPADNTFMDQYNEGVLLRIFNMMMLIIFYIDEFELCHEVKNGLVDQPTCLRFVKFIQNNCKC